VPCELIANTQERIRKSLRALLESRADLEVCEAASGQEAIEQVRQLKPDLVILDVSAPMLTLGFDTAREIRKIAPQTGLLIMSIDHTSGHIEQAHKIGARGYIVKAEAGDTFDLKVVV